MAGASPWFFTHYGADTWNKVSPASASFAHDLTLGQQNWLFKSDTLWTDRWDQLLTLAPQFVEIITWNDFGESHYVGPIEGIQPMSQAWVNGFDHTGTHHTRRLVTRSSLL